jgi:hypothetical protein
VSLGQHESVLASALPYGGSTAKVQARVKDIRDAHPGISPALSGVLDLVSEVLDRAALLEASRPGAQRGSPVLKVVAVSELLGRIEEVLPLDSGAT